MENLHIFPDSRYTLDFLLYLKSLRVEKQIILIDLENNTKSGFDYLRFSSEAIKVILIKNDIVSKFQFSKLVKNAKRIFQHGFFNNKLMLIYLLNNQYVGKIYWIIWGSDLYSRSANPKTIKTIVIEMLRKRLFNKIKKVITWTDDDYSNLKLWYETNAIKLELNFYLLSFERKYNKPFLNFNSSNALRVQLGNSSSTTGNHVELLSKLHELSLDFRVILILPLTYGNKENRQFIIDSLPKYKNFEFEVLTDYMDQVDYNIMLNTNDVVIFNNTRQEGLGNIYQLLLFGKKLYLQANTPVYNHLKSMGVAVFDIGNDMINLNKPLTINQVVSNNNIIGNYLSKEIITSQWNKLLNY